MLRKCLIFMNLRLDAYRNIAHKTTQVCELGVLSGRFFSCTTMTFNPCDPKYIKT